MSTRPEPGAGELPGRSKTAAAALVLQLQAEMRVANQALRHESKKLQRLIQALRHDLSQAEQAPLLREMGEVVKVQLARVPRGCSEVELSYPWEPERKIKVVLQRDLSPQQNVDRLFRRAKGLALGARIIQQRLEKAEDRLGKLKQLQLGASALLQSAEQLDLATIAGGQAPSATPLWRQVQDWKKSVHAVGLPTSDRVAPPTVAEQKLSRQTRGELPKGVEVFTTSSDRILLIGRKAQGNDALVTRLLRGRDVWLHVRDHTGAHGALRMQPEEPLPMAELLAAAALVAHLSGLPKGEAVDVTWTLGKYVRKVKGLAAGQVYVSQEHVVRVVVDQAVVDGFYARRNRPQA